MAPPLSRNESISLEGDLKILVDNHIIDETLKKNILIPLSSGEVYNRLSPRRFYTNSEDESEEEDQEEDQEERQQLVQGVASRAVQGMRRMQQNDPEPDPNIPQEVQVQNREDAEFVITTMEGLSNFTPEIQQQLLTQLLVPMAHARIRQQENEQKHVHKLESDELTQRLDESHTASRTRETLELQNYNFEMLIQNLIIVLFGGVAYYTYYATRTNMLIELVHSLATNLEVWENWLGDYATEYDATYQNALEEAHAPDVFQIGASDAIAGDWWDTVSHPLDSIGRTWDTVASPLATMGEAIEGAFFRTINRIVRYVLLGRGTVRGVLTAAQWVTQLFIGLVDVGAVAACAAIGFVGIITLIFCSRLLKVRRIKGPFIEVDLDQGPPLQEQQEIKRTIVNASLGDSDALRRMVTNPVLRIPGPRAGRRRRVKPTPPRRQRITGGEEGRPPDADVVEQKHAPVSDVILVPAAPTAEVDEQKHEDGPDVILVPAAPPAADPDAILLPPPAQFQERKPMSIVAHDDSDSEADSDSEDLDANTKFGFISELVRRRRRKDSGGKFRLYKQTKSEQFNHCCPRCCKCDCDSCTERKREYDEDPSLLAGRKRKPF